MRILVCVLCVLWASVVFGQQDYVPYTPGSTTQMVPVTRPPLPNNYPRPVPVQSQPPLPYQDWREGMRESFTHTDVHEIRPMRDWEAYRDYDWGRDRDYVPAYRPQYYQQPTYYVPQQQPTYYYVQPQSQCQYQYYCRPQYWYCPPQQRCLGFSW